MHIKPAVSFFVKVLLLLVAAISSTAAQTPQCTVGHVIPCVVDWYQLSAVSTRTESYGEAVTLLSGGDTLMAGWSRNSVYTDRDVFRFSSNGTPVYGSGIAGVPWYIGANSAIEYAGFPWQKIVSDEARGRVFVLFAANVPGSLQYDFFLAAHDLATGAKLAGWGGTTRFVGHATDPIGSIDIDGNGDVWTIWQADTTTYLKKFQGSSGTNVTPTNLTPPTDYFMIPSPAGSPRRFQAFGVRKSDNKLLIAFQEAPYDSVVTLWNSSLQFLGRYNYTKELGAPEVIPPPGNCCGTSLTTDHPYFFDGFVDNQGSLALGGSYRFKRWRFEFERYYEFPVVVRFALDASGTAIQLGSEFFDDQHPAVLMYESALERLPVQIIGSPQGDVYVQGPGSTVYLISSQGTYLGNVWLTAPFSGDMGSAGCRYLAFPAATSLSVDDDRLVLSGTVRKIGNRCGGEDPTAFTISYRRTFSGKCCRIRHFTWQEFSRFDWFWRRWQGGFPPPPSCPNCGAIARQPLQLGRTLSSLVRDAGLIMAVATSAEFGGKVTNRLADSIRNLAVGRYFTAQRQKSIEGALKRASRDGQISTDLRSSLLETINDVLLDRAIVESNSVTIQGGRQSGSTGGALVTFSDVATKGALQLEIQSGLPAMPMDMDPVFPVATFRLRFSGKLGPKNTNEILFDLHQFELPPHAAALHVLRWDGKSYHDVTSAFNLDERVATARTDQLGDFVFTVSYVGKDGSLAGKSW